MTYLTANLALPFLQPGQAQKELTHNEALARLDIAVQASVVAAGTDLPASDPREGQCWIVGSAGTGDWSGQADAVAGWTPGGWRFVRPWQGMQVWDQEHAKCLRWNGNRWEDEEVSGERVLVNGQQVVGPRQPGIIGPIGGSVVDVQARETIASMLGALAAHGLIGG